MKRKIRQILGVLLSLILLVGVMPASALEGDCQHTSTQRIEEGNDIVVRCLDCNAEISRTPKHVHSYTSEVRQEPTCNRAGVRIYTCECGDYYEEEIPTIAHNYEFAYTKAPTCVAGGYDVYICSVCGAEENRNSTEALGHNYEDIVSDLGNGTQYTVTKCSRCGDVLSEGQSSGHTHSYTSNITTPATCTEDGVRTYTCSDCGDTYTEVIPATGHNFYWEVQNPGNCTTDKVEVQVCATCGATGETRTTPAPGHSFKQIEEIIVAPTCDSEGVAAKVCEVCGYKERHEIPNLDHDYVETKRVESTCTEAGYIKYTCSNCSDSYKEYLPLADHTYTHSVVVPATCEADGYEADVCTVCGHEDNIVTIPATGHNYEVTAITPATCTEEGQKTLTCSNCGRIIYESIPAIGHEYGDWVVTKEPSCTETGIETRYCTHNPSHTQTRPIDMIDHTYEWVVTTEPTVLAAGVESYKCTVCGDVAQTREIPKLTHEHEFINDEVVTAPTCQSTGVGRHTCSICNETFTYEIPAVDHNYGEATVDFASTCVTQGQQSCKCIWCGIKDGQSIERLPLAEHTYSDEYTVDTAPTCHSLGSESRHCTVDGCEARTDVRDIEMTSHTMVETSRIPATCTENGTITYTCRDCDYTETDTTTLAATGHHYVATTVAPTCTEAGYTTHTCSGCGDTYTDSEVEALNHNAGEVVKENEVLPTCTSTGHYDDVVYCTRCGEELSRETITTEKIDHTPGAVVKENTVEATCTEDGSYDNATYCTVCGEEINRETVAVEALGHDYVDVVTAPTCTEAGYTTHTCSRCGDVYTDTETEALGHTEGEWVTTISSTCSTKGTAEKHCTVCDELLDTKELELDPTNHESLIVNSENEVDPTCTEAGKRIDTCSGCGEEVEVEVPALGHDYKATVTTEPTYDSEGVKTYTCTRCNDTYTESIPKLTRPSSNDDNKKDETDNNTPASTEEATSDTVTDNTVTDDTVTATDTTPIDVTPTEQTTDVKPDAEEKSDSLVIVSPKIDEENIEEIINQISSVTNEVVTLEVEDMHIAKEILQAALESGNTLVIKNDKYSWTIEASSIGELNDIDLGVNIGTSNIPEEKINTISDGNDFLELTLDYDGPFGFTGTLNIEVNDEYNNKIAILYYYNNGTFERMGSCVVTGNEASFDFVHASEYVVVFADDDNEVLQNNNTDNTDTQIIEVGKETTNENPAMIQAKEEGRKHLPIVPIVILVIAVIVGAAGFVVINKRRKN